MLHQFLWVKPKFSFSNYTLAGHFYQEMVFVDEHYLPEFEILKVVEVFVEDSSGQRPITKL